MRAESRTRSTSPVTPRATSCRSLPVDGLSDRGRRSPSARSRCREAQAPEPRLIATGATRSIVAPRSAASLHNWHRFTHEYATQSPSSSGRRTSNSACTARPSLARRADRAIRAWRCRRVAPEVRGSCHLRAQCTHSANATGRTMSIAADERLQKKRRVLQSTQPGCIKVRQRVGLEHRLGHLTARRRRRPPHRYRENVFDLRSACRACSGKRAVEPWPKPMWIAPA
jgi:hypothetical protein